jgi:hypothetical protein
MTSNLIHGTAAVAYFMTLSVSRIYTYSVEWYDE